MAVDAKFLLWLLLLSSSSSCFGSELDIQCLKSVQQSVIDPNGVLISSWNFTQSTSDFICQFAGVECWQNGRNMVRYLILRDLGLQGPFPRGLQNCSSINGLDLSNNSFHGSIPPDISRQMPYLTLLDLSYNSFSGVIPSNISNMTYLILLNLQHNQLSGPIPAGANTFTQLTTFNVSDNLLSGSIPSFLQVFSAWNFVGNQELCGSPLDECPPSGKRTGQINDESSIGAAVGFVVGFVVALYFSLCFICSKRLRAYVLY